MLFNTVIKLDTRTSMTHNIRTSTLCLLLLLFLYMINNTLSIIGNFNAQNRIIPPSTTIILEINIVSAIIPFMITGINRWYYYYYYCCCHYYDGLLQLLLLLWLVSILS